MTDLYKITVGNNWQRRIYQPTLTIIFVIGLVHLKQFFIVVMYELSSMNKDKNGDIAADVSFNLYDSQVSLPWFLLCLLVLKEHTGSFYLLNCFCISALAFHLFNYRLCILSACFISNTKSLAHLFVECSQSFQELFKVRFQTFKILSVQSHKRHDKVLWKHTARKRKLPKSFLDFFPLVGLYFLHNPKEVFYRTVLIFFKTITVKVK